jgi:holliday junction DNA helicase RuvA
MFAYIRGRLIQTTPSNVVLEAGGIGYKINIPVNLFPKLPQTGIEVILYTSFVVREFSQTLYGFLSTDDCELFEILLGVTGIGPKIALSIIGHLTIPMLQQAIGNHELAVLCKVPGVGKKTAERLIIELRDKVSAFQTSHFANSGIIVPLDSKAQKIRDAMGALINLGYNQTVAQKAIKKALEETDQEINLASLITLSLQNI